MLPPTHLHGRPLLSTGLAGLVLVFGSTAATLAQVPLHQRIDAAIASKPGFEKQAASLSSDAEFLRRAYLDLTGTIPPSDEARAFLKDAAADKRPRLIERLLGSPEFARHLQNVVDVLLMDRRPDRAVPRALWQDYLRQSFLDDKPWDQLVREILSADGTDPKLRPAAKFFLDRNGEPHQLTRDLGRLFLGMNLQCAQCHDHPLFDDYKQADYYGLFAFWSRSSVFTERAGRLVVADKADGEVTYQSVFDPAKVTKTAGPRLPGEAALKEPAVEKGKEYEVAPKAGVRPVPKHSRRALLGPNLASVENRLFKRGSANRFWALLMGRGLVHPVDQDHSGNPTSHPELLDLLAEEFAALKFDVRAFLRELALSQTYQRSSEPPDQGPAAAPEAFAVANLKPLTPEQLALSMMQATGLTDAERLALGQKRTEPALYARLAGNVAAFATTFGGTPGEPQDGEFQASLEQTLFLTNGPLIRSWLTPRTGNLMDRLGKLAAPEAAAEELYLSILTRPPTPEEIREVAEYLESRQVDRTAVLGELAWALLASAEFRFNH